MLENLRHINDKLEVTARKLFRIILFKGNDVHKIVRVLSGGEKVDLDLLVY